MARDTAEDWKRIGETEPWWGVLSAPEFLQANITEETKERFYAQGRDEMAWVMETLAQHFGAIKPDVGLDFGAGLGRLSFPMAHVCREVYGVDISPGMRQEAERQAQRREIQNVRFVDTVPDNLQSDWINSYIVFQHILPRMGYHILRSLCATLNPGGVASVHMTFAHDSRDNNTLVRDLLSWRFDGDTLTALENNEHRPGEQSMYDYDMNVVLMIFARAGIRDVLLRHTDHGGAHGYWFFGRKTH
ncbi:class I SAM-dependent methyltransferase [Acidisphaera sp. L21]|uniref:class I SAM-dependent methyltransferase n=1 Tax=Acidisphaera sp. L21 TaxID=1641851 RepID=UPI00131AF250|nr:class I SAM-dependent methyltransferase [Acidisphaera sp. L21]